jgi:hypothetical protein
VKIRLATSFRPGQPTLASRLRLASDYPAFHTGGPHIVRDLRARLGNAEFDWGARGVEKRFDIQGDRIQGSYVHEFDGLRELLGVPVYVVAASVFLRIETRRAARYGTWLAPDWPSDHDQGGGVREPRHQPPGGGATPARLGLPDQPDGAARPPIDHP